MKILASKIREDLKNIRYYYSRKKAFDSVSVSIGENEVVKKIEIYNKAIKSAEPKMFDLYITLYVENNTQDSLSDKWGYSIQHCSRLNCQLVDFFQKEFEKEEYDEIFAKI